MLSVLQQHHNVTPLGEVWNGTVQNGMSRMVTHIPENAQNGMMISATDNKSVSQPSRTISCGKSADTNVKINNNITITNRKSALVENLVDTTVLIIDAIWYNFPVNLNSQVIPLRLFIQETLRRSRTSWSTLQTALFYLMTIKQQITLLWLNPDRWMNSKDDDNNNNNPGSDPATCGRRMFLASLIVASKYLQDRNYANNAWSKICGLPVQEINVIERRFLKLIDYNLFIGKDKYKLWADLLQNHIQTISESPKSDSTSAEINQQIVAKFEQSLQQCKMQG